MLLKHSLFDINQSTRKFADKVTKIYSYTFNIAGLGGILTSGSIGFGAGQSHSPVTNGREKCMSFAVLIIHCKRSNNNLVVIPDIFFAMPHIGVSEKGVIGDIRRPGRSKVSHACGALIAIQKMAKKGTPTKYYDPDNVEFSRLTKRTLVDSVSTLLHCRSLQKCCKFMCNFQNALTRYGKAGPSLVQVTSHTAKVN